MFNNQHTEPETLEAIRSAVIKGPMPAELRREQAISFVYGTLGSKSTLTRAQVEQMVKRHLGD